MLALRTVGSIKLRALSLRDFRPHLMAEAISYELEDAEVRSHAQFSLKTKKKQHIFLYGDSTAYECNVKPNPVHPGIYFLSLICFH